MTASGHCPPRPDLKLSCNHPVEKHQVVFHRWSDLMPPAHTPLCRMIASCLGPDLMIPSDPRPWVGLCHQVIPTWSLTPPLNRMIASNR